MFGIDAGNLGFDNGEREFGGIAVEAPAWEATPSAYPGLTLQWGSFLDTRFGVTLDGSGNVKAWTSRVDSPAVYPNTTVPFKFIARAPSLAVAPSIGSGTAPPSGAQYFYFDGTEHLRSSALYQFTERYSYIAYTATAGAGLNEGLWTGVNTLFEWRQDTASLVPATVGGPRSDGVNDWLELRTVGGGGTVGDGFGVQVNQLFYVDGTAGSASFAVYADALSSYASGYGSAAQLPWALPAYFADSQGYMAVGQYTETADGISYAYFGAYDGVSRSVGGGPLNDGWQMVRVPLGVTADAVVQVRWNTTTMGIRVVNASANTDSGWVTNAFSGVAVFNGVARLFATYTLGGLYFQGIIYDCSTLNRTYTDAEADEAVRAQQQIVMTNLINAGFAAVDGDMRYLLGPEMLNEYASDYSPGFISFVIARPDAPSYVVTANGYDGAGIWCTASYFNGLGVTNFGGVDKFAPWVFDSGSVADSVVRVTDPGTPPWHLVTQQFTNGKNRARIDGDATSDVAAIVANGRTPTAYYGDIGLSTGGSQFTGGLALWAVAPSAGWEEARVRDVERWLNAEFMSASATTYTFTLSETFALTESIARRMQYERKPSETIVETEGLARTMTYGRKPTVDACVVSESFARTMFYGRKPTTDALVATESIAETASRARVVGDTLVETESIARSMTYGRVPATDAVVETESLARTMTYGRKPLENVVLTDALTETAVRARTMSDTIVETESIARTMTYGRTPATDALGAIDGQTRTMTYGRTPAETIVLVESLASTKTFGRSMADTLVVTDAFSRTVTYGRKPAETCALVDGISTAKTLSRSMADTLVETESITRSMSYGRKPAETCVLTESIARSMTYGRAFGDTCTATDATLRTLMIERSSSDGVGTSESFARSVEYGRKPAENLALIDALTFQAYLSISATMSDTLAAVEGLRVEASYLRSASDSIVALDALDSVLIRLIARDISDAIDVTEGFSSAANYVRRAADVAALSESFAHAASFVRSAGPDTIALSDGLSRVHTMHRIVNETVGVIEGLGYDLAGIIVRTMGDSIALVETLSRVHTASRTMGDALAVTDSVKASRERAYLISDTLAPVDSVQRALAFGRSFLDIVNVADTVAREVDFDRTSDDAVVLSDAARTSFAFARTADDIVALAETFDGRFVFIGVERVREMNDTIRLVDGVRAELHRIEAGYITFGDKLSKTSIDFGDIGAATTILIGAPAPATEISIMSYSEGFDVGDVAEIPFTVRKKRTGELTTPDTLRVLVQPGRTAATFAIVYDGIDGRLVEDDEGEYRMLLPCTVAGDWTVQVETTGEAAAIQPTRFKVRAPLLSL